MNFNLLFLALGIGLLVGCSEKNAKPVDQSFTFIKPDAAITEHETITYTDNQGKELTVIYNHNADLAYIDYKGSRLELPAIKTGSQDAYKKSGFELRHTDNEVIFSKDDKVIFSSKKIKDKSPTQKLSWEKMITLIQQGDIVSVSQSHTLNVTITHKNGTMYIAQEPEMDAVLTVINQCKKCAGLHVATE